jgi:hypothetical protein
MSDREIYCDREPYDRSSTIILLDIDEKSIKNDIELLYVKKYKSYWHRYMELCSDIKYRSYALNETSKQLGNKFTNSPTFINETKEIIEKTNQKNNIYNELAKLESSTPIQNVLSRERKPNEVVELEFLNCELPNIPYNVLSHNSNDYLPNDEKANSHNNLNSLPSEDETTQQKKKSLNKSFLFIPLALSIVFLISICPLPYGFYTFTRITVFALSLLFLYLWYKKINKFTAGFIPAIIIAILWNPIIPIYLDRDTWAHFDLFAAILEIIILILAYYTTKKK